nr:hypothetical protein CFP56_31658 [Quercus suber]
MKVGLENATNETAIAKEDRSETPSCGRERDFRRRKNVQPAEECGLEVSEDRGIPREGECKAVPTRLAAMVVGRWSRSERNRIGQKWAALETIDEDLGSESPAPSSLDNERDNDSSWYVHTVSQNGVSSVEKTSTSQGPQRIFTCRPRRGSLLLPPPPSTTLPPRTEGGVVRVAVIWLRHCGRGSNAAAHYCRCSCSCGVAGRQSQAWSSLSLTVPRRIH